MSVGKWLEKAVDYLGQGMWEADLRVLTPLRRNSIRFLQFAYVVGRDFYHDRCMLRASALTYTTLLSIVPLFALMFAVLKGMGFQDALAPILLEEIAVGSEQIVSEILFYIENTHVGKLGAAGLVSLILTVLALLSNIEMTFNHIWGVKETRPFFRRFADYSSVIIVGPVFIFAAISMTTTLQGGWVVQKLLGVSYLGDILLLIFKFLPFLIMWAAFVSLYVFMPNIKVTFKAALAGGILGGTLWQLAQWAYIYFQVGVARYNAIYGTMAALPIFMVWIYISWLIVLLGVEVTYAFQNLRSIRGEMSGEGMNFASREVVALTILRRTASVFLKGEKPQDRETIAEELKLSSRATQDLLDELVRLGFLSEVRKGGDGEFAYQPARSPEKTEVSTVFEALRSDGVAWVRREGGEELEEVDRRLRQAAHAALEGMTLADLTRERETSNDKSLSS